MINTENFRIALANKKMKVTELAKKLDMSAPGLYKVLYSGNTKYATAIKIAEILEVDLDFLQGKTDQNLVNDEKGLYTKRLLEDRVSVLEQRILKLEQKVDVLTDKANG